MAARQIVEVVQCRVADLKIGDVVRLTGGSAEDLNPWFVLKEVTAKESGRLKVVGESMYDLASLLPFDLVDLQLTKAVYSNAPHTVDVSLPGDEPVGVSASVDAVLPWDDEDGEVRVTIYRSPRDGAAVVEIDTTFEPYGADYDPSGEPPGDNIRINLNDGTIWDNGLWDGRNDQLVPDPR